MKTLTIASMGAFAAIYAILRIIPTFPVIGLPSASFSVSDFLVPIYGIILGPYLAAGTIFFGTFLAVVFGKPLIFLGLDFIPGCLGAFAAGMISRDIKFRITEHSITSSSRAIIVRGDNVIAILFALVLILFWSLPLTEVFIPITDQISMPFNSMHLLALAVLISPLGKASQKWISSSSPSLILRGIIIISLIGTMFQHAIGSIVFESIMGLYLGSISAEAFPGIWKVIFPLIPIERSILILGSTLLGVPLIRSLRTSGFDKKILER